MATEALNAEARDARKTAAGAAGTFALALGYLNEARGDITLGSLDTVAAAHVLNRLGFGGRPGDLDRVLARGLDRYIDDQLRPGPDPALDQRLASFSYLSWTPAEAYSQYLAYQRTQDNPVATRLANPIPDLHAQLRSAQIIRGVHSQNQLLEVMTWFWFNHFNVNLGDDFVQYSGHDYERVLRQNALGKFKNLLAATAHHPAMMSYLDNYLSTVPRFSGTRLTSGINENYGRELLELHTISVHGDDYTQDDVYSAAVILTGWGLGTVPNPTAALPNRTSRGPVFAFTTRDHDTRATQVMDLRIAAGMQKQSGDMLLDYLAHHPATAQFIATKLVRHFVADDPPQPLVSRVADTFMTTDGDVSEMLRTIFASKEFWNEAFAVKYKNPFQSVVSTLRALDAEVTDGRSLSTLLNSMGQPQYACIPPTGWSDRGLEWVNPASHMYRMNFALDLVSSANTTPIAGVRVDVARLLRNAGVNAGDGAEVAAYFNHSLFGGKLSARTVGAATNAGSSSTVPAANRVIGLLLAGPEAQGR